MGSKLPVRIKKLHIPSLSKLIKVLQNGLNNNYKDVNVSLVDCPNLTEKPFTLAAPGLCGCPRIIDLGGPLYQLPCPNYEKFYDIKELCKLVGLHTYSMVIGPGTGPWTSVGVNSEGVFNLSIIKGNVRNMSKVAKVGPRGENIQEELPEEETNCAMLANLFVSQGKSGKVIKVHCKKRTGSKNFIESMRTSISKYYGEQRVVGMGGTFYIKQGKVLHHVMQDFIDVPINTKDKLLNWLRFYVLSAPLVSVGTFVTSGYGLDLRLQNFHSFSHHGEAGHYLNDLPSDLVEYIGYFNVASEVYRIDQPRSNLLTK